MRSCCCPLLLPLPLPWTRSCDNPRRCSARLPRSTAAIISQWALFIRASRPLQPCIAEHRARA